MKETESVDFEPGDMYPVKDFAARWRPGWTEPALRNLILNSEDRINSRGETVPGNGLAEAGAVLRCGRKVLICESAFKRWLSQQAHRSRGAKA